MKHEKQPGPPEVHRAKSESTWQQPLVSYIGLMGNLEINLEQSVRDLPAALAGMLVSSLVLVRLSEVRIEPDIPPCLFSWEEMASLGVVRVLCSLDESL